MIDREAIAPLIIGLIVALLVHAALVPAAAVAVMSYQPDEHTAALEQEAQEPREEEKQQQQEEEKPKPQPQQDDNIRLGKEESEDTVRMAWISHEAFEKLMTDEASETLQPALQDVVQPVEQAPTPMNPTPQALVSDAAQQALPTPPATMPVEPEPTEARQETQDAPDQQQEAEAPEKIEDAKPAKQTESAPLAITPAKSDIKTEKAKTDSQVLAAQDRVKATGPKSDSTPTRSEQAEAKEDKKKQRPKPAQRVEPSKAAQRSAAAPTAAALGKTRVMPTTRVDMRRRRIGGVDVAKGLEVLPAYPRFNVISRISVVPSNPKAEITFDRKGRVKTAKLTKSTGYAGYDSPILESLYRWRAKGEALEKSDAGVTIPLDLILK